MFGASLLEWISVLNIHDKQKCQSVPHEGKVNISYRDKIQENISHVFKVNLIQNIHRYSLCFNEQGQNAKIFSLMLLMGFKRSQTMHLS